MAERTRSRSFAVLVAVPTGIAVIVFGVLMWNVYLTRRARRRKASLESFASRLRMT